MKNGLALWSSHCKIWLSKNTIPQGSECENHDDEGVFDGVPSSIVELVIAVIVVTSV